MQPRLCSFGGFTASTESPPSFHISMPTSGPSSFMMPELRKSRDGDAMASHGNTDNLLEGIGHSHDSQHINRFDHNRHLAGYSAPGLSERLPTPHIHGLPFATSAHWRSTAQANGGLEPKVQHGVRRNPRASRFFRQGLPTFDTSAYQPHKSTPAGTSSTAALTLPSDMGAPTEPQRADVEQKTVIAALRAENMILRKDIAVMRTERGSCRCRRGKAIAV